MYSLDLIRKFLDEFTQESQCPAREIQQVIPLLGPDTEAAPPGPFIVHNKDRLSEAIRNARSVPDFSRSKPHVRWNVQKPILT